MDQHRKPSTTLRGRAIRPRRHSSLGAAAVTALAAAVLFFAPVLCADEVVTTLYTAKTSAGDSPSFSVVGATSTDVLWLQVTWTGTAAPVLKATIDGTNWDTTYTPTSGKLFSAPLLGGGVYKLNIPACAGCTVDASVTVTGRAQVRTWTP